MTTPNETEPLFQFFRYAHLPPALQDVSRPYHEMAAWLIAAVPRNPERTVALRKLLESKDCAVRAALFVMPGEHLTGPAGGNP